jgi:2,3-bisphosphoglycerate-independent phosphoglycerate mutase
MKLLFIFMDGVGLGKDDSNINPFIRAAVPNLDHLLDGNKIIAANHRTGLFDGLSLIQTTRASLLALDACLGIEGIPQSASGQASLLTGKNVSAILGFHDGPKPSPVIMDILREGTLFSQVNNNEMAATLLNAYPPRYFKSIETGYRLPGVIALSASYAGMQLKTMDDLYRGEAISTDFTAQGWRDVLGFLDTPLLNPIQAGERMRQLSTGYELTFFEYWLTDVAGHQQDMQSACDLLEIFDAMLGSLVNSWDDDESLILITSDHGNIEDLSIRRHTRNDIPLLLIGSSELREQFINELTKISRSRDKFNLTDVSPSIINLLKNLK